MIIAKGKNICEGALKTLIPLLGFRSKGIPLSLWKEAKI